MRRKKISAAATGRWIGLAAASTLLDPALLEQGLPRFARWGYAVRADDTLFERFRYFAGTDEIRAAALLRLLRDPSVGSIWCARGGYGASRLLKLLDKAGAPQAMAKDPKLLFGFSDATALHLYFYHHLKLPSVHSLMPSSRKWLQMSSGTERVLRALLAGKLPLGRASHTASWPVRSWGKKQTAAGVILGGNLSLLATLAGTPWQPDLNGSLLFLEDCGEAPYRVDRMLSQLDNAGMLKGVRGVLLGDFEADVVYREPKERTYWKAIFLERFGHLPVLSGLPVGHGKRNEPLPLGVRAEITRSGKLVLLEQPVQA